MTDGKRWSSGRRFGGERLAAGLLALVVIGSVLAVGTVHISTLLAASAIAVAATVLAVRQEILDTGNIPWSAPALVIAGLSAYTLLQAVPLPMAVLERIAPSNADVWQRALVPFGEPPPQWAPISLDPGATFVEALKWFVYACVFTTSAVTCSRRGAHWGTGLVFVSALLSVLTTIGHGLAGAKRVFGVYEPHVSLAPWHMGPLLNSNNLAGYLNLGAMCGLGLLLMHRPPAPRWAIGIGTAAIIGVAVTAASRAGFAVFPLGVLLFAAALQWRRSRSKHRHSRSQYRTSNGAVLLLVGAAVVGGAAFALLGASRQVWAELYDRNLMKLAMVLWAKPMVADHAIWGIGRGAFASVFPAYRTQPGHSVWTHPENFVVQWVVEWGVPVGVLGLGLLAWLLRPGALGVRRSAVASGAGIGVAIVLLQNLADLGTEIPGICIALATVLGALWGDGMRRGLPPDEQLWLGNLSDPQEILAGSWRRRKDLVLPIGVAAVAVVLMTLVSVRGWRTLDKDRQAAHEQFESAAARSAAGRAQLRTVLRSAMAAHPAEPYFPLLGAIAYWLGGEESPVPWLQRSLERSHVNGRAHLLLAELLATTNAKAQALLELRLAIQDDPGTTSSAARVALRITHSLDELMEAVPSGAAGAGMLDACAASLGNPDRALRIRLYHEAIARDASLVRPRIALAGELLHDLEQAAQEPTDADKGRALPCKDQDRAACIAEFEAHVRAVELASPDWSWPHQLRAKLLVASGRSDEGVKLLAERCPNVKDRLSCMQALVVLSVRARTSAAGELAVLLKEVVALGCAEASCADTMLWAGDTLASQGDMGGAMTYYERAVRDVPTEAGWVRLASAASRIGAHARAAEALERVARLHGGGDAELKARIDMERARALRIHR